MIFRQQIVFIRKTKKPVPGREKRRGRLFQRRRQIGRRHANVDMPAAARNIYARGFRTRICG